MIRLRLATEAGIQEITPASLTHCAGCEQEYYLDGPADADPHFCCEVYDRRTDRRRLPECIRATNPVIVEEMRLRARHPAYGNTVVVPFPEERRPLPKSANVMGVWATQFMHQTLRFQKTVCECNTHGEFWATLLPGEKPFCPFCIASWEADMRRVLASILQHARRWSELADIIDPYLPPERAIDLMRWLPRFPIDMVSWTPNPVKLLNCP